jgi:Zn-dependent peptidase ImmA (M78 family)/transcriptional regulator with XRE-family HTH domain
VFHSDWTIPADPLHGAGRACELSVGDSGNLVLTRRSYSRQLSSMVAKARDFAIGQRLRRARQARGLSLQQVVDRLSRPLTRAALSKYERGETVPRADLLVDLGRVLGLPGSYFLEPPMGEEDRVKWLAYRKHSALGTRQGERIQAQAELATSAYHRLLDLLRPDDEACFPRSRSASTVDEAEEAAESLRDRWGLGSGPIDSVVSCAEDAGALVLAWNDHARFDALAGWTGSGRPIIVLNLDRPDDRLRFNLAHELGHLAMEADSLEPREEEALAHRFAAAFLVPREIAYHELGRRRTRITVAELEYLKGKYGFSMQAWTRRARDLGIITERVYRNWQIWFRVEKLRIRETVEYVGQEAPSRLRILAVQALTEGLVDRSWVQSFCPEAAEQAFDDAEETALNSLLQKPAEERRQTLEEAATAASDLYTDAPEVEEFLGFDDSTEDDE